MNDITLEVKTVDFNGAELLAVKNTNDKIYVGVSWVCNGLGLSVDQVKNERKKIQSDLVLKQGGLNLTLPTNGGNQDSLCIELDFLPLWLAKISITPAMQENNPELVKKLIEYQLKAKDVLAKTFISEKLAPQTFAQALRLAADLEEKNEQLLLENKQKQQEIEYKEDVIIGLVDEVTLAEKRQILNRVVKKTTNGNYQQRYNELYKQFNDKYHCNVKQRYDSYNASHKPKLTSMMDYIDKIMGKIPELYEMACKLYENDVKKLVEEMYALNKK